MNSQKRIGIVLLCFLLGLSSFACGKKEKKEPEKDNNPVVDEQGGEDTFFDTTKPYIECSGAKASVISDKNYLREDGEMQVIKYTQEQGVWTGIKFIYSNQFDWTQMKDPEFYVYNPTEYDYILDIFCTMDTTAHTFQDMMSVCKHTATAKQWTKIEVSADVVATTSNHGLYPFLGISVTDDDNGGENSTKWDALELYFDGFGFLLQDPETRYDFINAEILEIGGAVVEVSNEEKYSKDINGKSLKYTRTGSSTAFKFIGSSSIDWTKPEIFTFWVYNPTSYDYIFNVMMTKNENEDFKDLITLESPFEAAANGWTQVVIYGESLKKASGEGNTTLDFYIEHPTNGKVGSEQWDSIELYFSGFSLVYGD